MNICLLVFKIDSLTYTIAKALGWGEHEVFMFAKAFEGGDPGFHVLSNALSRDSHVQDVTNKIELLPAHLDRLIVQSHPRLLGENGALSQLASRSTTIALLSAGDRICTLRKAIGMQRQEFRWLGPWLKKIDRVAYKDGCFPLDLFRFRFPRTVIGFDVHSQFLEDDDAFQAIHTPDWDPHGTRPILANFLGSQDPRARKLVLDSMRDRLSPQGKPRSDAVPGKTWFWNEYSDAKPGGISAFEFIQVLTDSDFTLCPRGYSLVTHRPMEALLRGSIPVIDKKEIELYAVELEDGVNCIAAPGDDWSSVVNRLLKMDEREIGEMRCRIRDMHQVLLDYPASSRNMRARLGIDDRSEAC
jgi:hypothetical protein